MAVYTRPSEQRYYCLFVILFAVFTLLASPSLVTAQPSDIMFTLRDSSEQAWKRAESGDRAGYNAALAKVRDYVRSVYRPADLDKGWKELASAQLSVGDREGAKTTAQTIRNPALRTRLFIDIASKYKDAAAFADALQVCFQCTSPEDIGPGARDLARDMHRAGFASQARDTLRLTTLKLHKPSPNPKTEEKRCYHLKQVVIDQIDYRDFEGAKITSRAISDPEHLALVAVGQYKAGKTADCQATFQEAIPLARKATGDLHPYFLERITYSLLDCGMVSTARTLAPTIPTGPRLNNNHREKAISRVAFTLADSRDIVGAKKMADTHRSLYFLTVSYLRAAAVQRLGGNEKAALTTIAEARQRVTAFPGQGVLQNHKVHCLNRLAFVQYLWNANDEWPRTLAVSRQFANKEPDEMPRMDKYTDIITMQAMCGDGKGALAAIQSLPPRYRAKAIAEVRKADEYRKNLAGSLEYECLDPRKSR